MPGVVEYMWSMINITGTAKLPGCSKMEIAEEKLMP